jgi:hypothetical protein
MAMKLGVIGGKKLAELELTPAWGGQMLGVESGRTMFR